MAIVVVVMCAVASARHRLLFAARGQQWRRFCVSARVLLLMPSIWRPFAVRFRCHDSVTGTKALLPSVVPEPERRQVGMLVRRNAGGERCRTVEEVIVESQLGRTPPHQRCWCCCHCNRTVERTVVVDCSR